MQRYEEKLRKKENYRVVAHLIENPRGSLKGSMLIAVTRLMSTIASPNDIGRPLFPCEYIRWVRS